MDIEVAYLDTEETETQQLKHEEFSREPVKNWPQYVATSSLTIFLLICGTVMGWTSPTLPLLKKEGLITDSEGTWISSLMPLVATVAPFPAGYCADYFGRKKSMLASGIMVLSSWCILATADKPIYFYIGRIIVGFAMGWGMTIYPMYIGETATPNMRGALGGIGRIQMCLGFVYVYSIGAFVSYIWLCILCGVLPIIFCLCFVFMPETPHFYLSKNDLVGASKSLQWLRGQSEKGVQQELSQLQMEVGKSLENKGTWAEMFMPPGNRKAILIIFGLMTLQQLSGINVVLFYSESIFAKAGSNLLPSMCTIVVGVVMTIASLIVPYGFERFGRRMITVVSAVGMAISLAPLGVYFYLEKLDIDNVATLSWLPLTSVIGYICTYSFGAGAAPYLMISEVFAPNIRGKGAALSSATSWGFAFVMTNYFAPVEAAIGTHGAFWLFAISSAIGAVVTYFCLPETKGKTLQEIQDMLNHKIVPI